MNIPTAETLSSKSSKQGLSSAGVRQIRLFFSARCARTRSLPEVDRDFSLSRPGVGKSNFLEATRFLLLVLAALSCHSFAEELAYQDPDIGIKFPKQLSNFQFLDKNEFGRPATDPGSPEISGYNLLYRGPGTNLQIRVEIKQKNFAPAEDGVDGEEADGWVGWVRKNIGMRVFELEHFDPGVEHVRRLGKAEIVFKDQPVPFLCEWGTMDWAYEIGSEQKHPGRFAIYNTSFRFHYIMVSAFYHEQNREVHEKIVAEALATVAKLIKDAKDSPPPKAEPAK